MGLALDWRDSFLKCIVSVLSGIRPFSMGWMGGRLYLNK